MNNVQQTARVGLFFLLGLALTWVTFETLRGGKVFKDQGYNLIAGFETLKELKEGDEVRMAGVKIGEVEKTRLAGRRAEAVLRINPTVKIKGDATATIVMAGLIGTNYIAIDLGSEAAARGPSASSTSCSRCCRPGTTPPGLWVTGTGTPERRRPQGPGADDRGLAHSSRSPVIPLC